MTHSPPSMVKDHTFALFNCWTLPLFGQEVYYLWYFLHQIKHISFEQLWKKKKHLTLLWLSCWSTHCTRIGERPFVWLVDLKTINGISQWLDIGRLHWTKTKRRAQYVNSICGYLCMGHQRKILYCIQGTDSFNNIQEDAYLKFDEDVQEA